MCRHIPKTPCSSNFPWQIGARCGRFECTKARCSNLEKQVLQVNLTSVFTLCHDVGAHMLEREPKASGSRRSIINVGSLLSFNGGIMVLACDAAVAWLTKALSKAWAGKSIAVNAIAPGHIATEMNAALMEEKDGAASIVTGRPLRRILKARLFLWSSGASGYVSGETLLVDGGWLGR